MTIIQILHFALSVVFAGALVIAVVATNNFNERLTLIEDNQRSLEAALLMKLDIQGEQLSRALGILRSPLLCATPPPMVIRAGSDDITVGGESNTITR